MFKHRESTRSGFGQNAKQILYFGYHNIANLDLTRFLSGLYPPRDISLMSVLVLTSSVIS